MTSSAAKKLEDNIATYSKNHFRHNKGQEFVPSLLKMQIHDTEDVSHSPSLLKMQIHDTEDVVHSPSLLKMQIHETDNMDSPSMLRSAVTNK
ncbi:MAG: hypothetical protein ACE3JP_15960 [Ectobacillus sp.]